MAEPSHCRHHTSTTASLFDINGFSLTYDGENASFLPIISQRDAKCLQSAVTEATMCDNILTALKGTGKISIVWRKQQLLVCKEKNLPANKKNIIYFHIRKLRIRQNFSNAMRDQNTGKVVWTLRFNQGCFKFHSPSHHQVLMLLIHNREVGANHL